jgi:hypothetical protein
MKQAGIGLGVVLFATGCSDAPRPVSLSAHEAGALVPEVAAAVHHDTSPPLRDIRGWLPVSATARAKPLRIPLRLGERRKGESGPDPVLQVAPASTATPTPLMTFEGLSDDDNAAVLGFRVVPPDTNGDVGTVHYVQLVNILIGVYDKATGALASGFPKPINAIWSGFGGICETNNDGDPIVLYDRLGGRWLVSQFALGADGHQCIAISTTEDPTGSYYRYDFLVSPGGTNDYPKLGVWGDAYYMSANEFNAGFEGAIAVAFDRPTMLIGESATMVKFGPLPCGAQCFYSLRELRFQHSHRQLQGAGLHVADG